MKTIEQEARERNQSEKIMRWMKRILFVAAFVWTFLGWLGVWKAIELLAQGLS